MGVLSKFFTKKYALFLSLAIILAFLFFIFSTPSYGANQELNGWGWSSNIGWVSFSKQSVSNPSGPQFGVSLDDVTGDITGYAWADSVGWLSFNASDLGPCPTTAGDEQAKVLNMTGGGTREVVGWARFLTGNTTQAGGWDGCVHLSSGTGGDHPTGVADGSGGVTLKEIPDPNGAGGTIDMFVGFAWGGDVVGWLDFAPFLQKPGVPCTNCGGGGCVGVCGGRGGGGTTVTLTANGQNPYTVSSGSDPFLVTVAWVITGNIPDHCTAVGDWSGSKSVSGGNESFNLANPGSYSFRLDCFNSSNVLIGSDTVPVTLSTGGVGGGGLNVLCEAVDSSGNATTTVPIGDPVRWRATVTPTDILTPIVFPIDYAWFNSPSGTPLGSPGSSNSNVIEIQRVYTTLGPKSVYIEITNTGNATPLTGSCSATPAMVNIRTKPIIQPF